MADTQVRKAAALIASGGLTATSRPGVYRAASSKGDATYLVTAQGVCYCPAGQRGTLCCHVMAARMMVCASLREQAEARGIRVLPAGSAQPIGADAEAGDLYSPAGGL